MYQTSAASSDHQDRAVGDHRALQPRQFKPEVVQEQIVGLDDRAGPLQERRDRLDVLLADRLAARIEDVERAEDAPGAERHDERRQPQQRDDQRR